MPGMDTQPSGETLRAERSRLQKQFKDPHFEDEETEAPRGHTIWLKECSELVAER